MKVETHCFSSHGNVRTDVFGRVVVDECCSDSDHLSNAPTDAKGERPRCRRLVESVFDELIGRKGAVQVTVTFVEDESCP